MGAFDDGGCGLCSALQRFSKRCVVLEYSELRVGIDGVRCTWTEYV